MDATPKLQRKSTLSLTTRLNHKRHSASPQNRMKTSNSRDYNANFEELQRSPSVISICSDGGIECTPPHKKIMMSLDDSMDYSPKVFDSSFSPTCLLSQTLAIDSPEVGWKWSRNSACGRGEGRFGFKDSPSTRTPDSAYAADSSFASAGSSSTEHTANVRTRSDRLAYDSRREQRKVLEQELRRVEKTRADEKLKQRCAKLQEQLKSAGTQKSSQNTMGSSNSYKTFSNSLSKDVEMRTQTSSLDSLSKTASTVKMMTPEKPKKQDTLNDFFNDSDSDCFLLAATQEIESKINIKTQPAFVNVSTTPKNTKSPTNSPLLCDTMPHASSAPPATTTPNVTPTTSNSNRNDSKEKRSSFYMKFLEDDCPDDWFVSLDEVILQATKSKKPRTSLQRYKSMPSETATNATAVSLGTTDQYTNSNLHSKKNVNSRLANVADNSAAASSSNITRMKRHSSTHSLSPANANSFDSFIHFQYVLSQNILRRTLETQKLLNQSLTCRLDVGFRRKPQHAYCSPSASPSSSQNFIIIISDDDDVDDDDGVVHDDKDNCEENFAISM